MTCCVNVMLHRFDVYVSNELILRSLLLTMGKSACRRQGKRREEWRRKIEKSSRVDK